MKSQRIAAVLLVLLFGLSPGAWADRWDDTREVFLGAGESARFFDHAHAYALFPTVGKAGVGVGGARGKGRVYVDGEHVADTTMTQLSVGLQLGGQAYSMIIFFEDERALREFSSGNFEFGAQAGAVAITAAAQASASTAGGATAGASGGRHDAVTAGDYHKGMAVFTVAKGGLMYEATLSGMKFNYRPVGGP